MGGGAAMAFVIQSPTGQHFQDVTWEDMRARRSVNERLLALTDGGDALPAAEARVSLLAVGDVMLSRMVGSRMLENGYEYPFEKVAEDLQAAAITFGNLESPIIAGRPIESGEMVFRADPEVAPVLADVGFDVLSLANNHIRNFGQDGLAETLRLLDEQAIKHVGAGLSPAEARSPAIIERSGLKFGFLAYTYDSTAIENGPVPLDIQLMEEDVAGLRPEVDFVIVSMHAGAEYQPRPGNRQIAFAHAAIDAGAEVVIGHHPHVVQTAEIYEGKYIFYSLGNFVFDQMWSWDTRRGLGVRLVFTKDGVRTANYLPVIIDDYAQPRPANNREAQLIIDRLDLPRDSD